MRSEDKIFSVILLAADRESTDPVAQHANVCCKALVPIHGRAMILRVLDALEGSREVDFPILAGPSKRCIDQNEELKELIVTQKISWTSPQATPSTSAFNILQSLPVDTPVLLTTADNTLLTPAMVDYFCSKARQSGCDVIAGVVNHDIIMKQFPGTRRTVTKLKDGGYCGCNMFAFMTPEARFAADYWRKVEKERKKPLRIIKIMGWVTVIKYLLGWLSLKEALDKLSVRMGLKVGVIQMPFAEAAIDVDKIDDLIQAKEILGQRNQGAPS